MEGVQTSYFIFFLACEIFSQRTAIDCWRLSWKLYHIKRFMSMSISGLSDEAYDIFGINQGSKLSLSLVINQKRQYFSNLDFAFIQMKSSQLTINIPYFAT